MAEAVAGTGTDKRRFFMTPAEGTFYKPNFKFDSLAQKGAAYGRVFLDCASEIRKNPEITATFFRAVTYMCTAAELVTGKVVFLSNLSARVAGVADLTDAISFLKSINDVNKAPSSKDDRVTQVIKHLANVVFTGVTGSCVLLLLDTFKFINLAHIADKIGNAAPVLNFVGKMTLVGALRGMLGVGYTIAGVEACLRLDRAINEEQKRKAMIDIAYSVAQISLQIVILAGAPVSLPIAALGVVAYSLGVTSFIYEYMNRDAINQKPQDPLNIQTETEALQKEVA